MSERPPKENFHQADSFPDRQSGLIRIANTAPETEEAGREAFADILEHQTVESFEREKNPAEKEVIKGILQFMPEFVRTYGGQPIERLSESNFHIVDETLLPAERRKALLEDNVAGRYDFRNQRLIVLPDNNSLLTTAQRMVHETLHMESFLSFTAEVGQPDIPQGKTALHLRRIGLSVFNDGETKRFFRDLDEAMVEELTARFDSRHLADIPSLASEVEQRSTIREQTWSEKRNDIAAVVNRQLPDSRWESVIRGWGYEKERRVLRNLIGELYSANRNRFASEDEVFSLFARAVFTGKLLEVGRLIEGTLGKTAFRALGKKTMFAE